MNFTNFDPQSTENQPNVVGGQLFIYFLNPEILKT